MNDINCSYFYWTLKSDQRIFVALIVFIASIVYAGQNSTLDLTLDLDQSNVNNILDRKDWREPAKEENTWRQNPVESTKNVRWGAKSIYEEDPRLGPIIPGEDRPSGVVDTPEAAPKFKLRF